MGIEPTSGAWEAPILPLNYARGNVRGIHFSSKSDALSNALANHASNKIFVCTSPLEATSLGLEEV